MHKILQLVKDNDLTIHALCNDYVVENSLLKEDVIQQNIDLIIDKDLKSLFLLFIILLYSVLAPSKSPNIRYLISAK